MRLLSLIAIFGVVLASRQNSTLSRVHRRAFGVAPEMINTLIPFASGALDINNLISTKLVLMGHGINDWISISPSSNFPSTAFNDYNLVASRYGVILPGDGNITSFSASVTVGTGSGIGTGLQYTVKLYGAVTQQSTDYSAQYLYYTALGSGSATITCPFSSAGAGLYRQCTETIVFNPPISVCAGTVIVPTFTTQRTSSNQMGFISVLGSFSYLQSPPTDGCSH